MEKVFIDIMCHFNKVDAVFKEVFCIKRLITAVILCIWTVCACAAVYAADPVDYADSLCSIGLFRGTENGYEIQKPLTRGEGAVMLLRLLELETAAEESGGTSPFTDGGWAEPYIGYAYQQGLVKGMSETEFGTQQPMTSGQYAVMLLRALGFEDGKDFTYNEAAAVFGALAGTGVDGTNRNIDRGEAARLSWAALGAKKDDGEPLYKQLMTEGVFTEQDYREAVRFLEETPTAESVTVLFYMIASDLESVQGRATEDIGELLALPKDGNINLVLQTGGTEQWKNDILTGGTVERSVIEDGALCVVQNLPDAQMTQPDTLTDFILWGQENYPADRYILVLWDHGFGTMGGFGLDKTAETESMPLDQLQAGVRGGGQRFGLIVFDACLMGTLETAYALRGNCDYIVASEELTPAAGLSYSGWLSALCQNPDMESYDVAKRIATEFDLHSGTYLGGKTGMAVIAPVWSHRTALAWEKILSAAPPGGVYAAAERCSELGLRDGGFDQYDLGELSEKLQADAEDLKFYTKKLVPFKKNGAALTGFTGLAVYLPSRHSSKYEEVRRALAGCGFSESYLKTYDIFNQEGGTRQ